jgi:hypothetical protein
LIKATTKLSASTTLETVTDTDVQTQTLRQTDIVTITSTQTDTSTITQTSTSTAPTVTVTSTPVDTCQPLPSPLTAVRSGYLRTADGKAVNMPSNYLTYSDSSAGPLRACFDPSNGQVNDCSGGQIFLQTCIERSNLDSNSNLAGCLLTFQGISDSYDVLKCSIIDTCGQLSCGYADRALGLYHCPSYGNYILTGRTSGNVQFPVQGRRGSPVTYTPCDSEPLYISLL